MSICGFVLHVPIHVHIQYISGASFKSWSPFIYCSVCMYACTLIIVNIVSKMTKFPHTKIRFMWPWFLGACIKQERICMKFGKYKVKENYFDCCSLSNSHELVFFNDNHITYLKIRKIAELALNNNHSLIHILCVFVWGYGSVTCVIR